MPKRKKSDRNATASRAIRLLPLILLASMMVIASIIEPILLGKTFGATKIPLALLLAWVLFRPSSGGNDASLP